MSNKYIIVDYEGTLLSDDKRWKFWSNEAYLQLKDFLLKKN